MGFKGNKRIRDGEEKEVFVVVGVVVSLMTHEGPGLREVLGSVYNRENY